MEYSSRYFRTKEQKKGSKHVLKKYSEKFIRIVVLR